MVTIHPHLGFNGQCEEAFNEYQGILGGTIRIMMKYGESPMAQEIAPDFHNHIIHASLDIGGFELAGADLLDYKKPQGFSIIVNIAEKAEAQRIFNALAIGGSIQLPFAETFWTAGFGVLTDRFGTPWEINCDQPPQSSV